MRKRIVILAVLCLFVSTAANAQFGRIGKALDQANDVKAKVDIRIGEEDEIAIGKEVSAKIIGVYGVVNDKDSHRYVTLVGKVLAKKSSRPSLPWEFIILDTDGVNAFATPGGFIHITRGALALMKSEAELAGVLSHEIAHVTKKHTVSAIEKDKGIQGVAKETKADAKLKDQPGVFQNLVNKTYEGVFAGFGRKEELESDSIAPGLAADAGYASAGLPQFLRTLQERNKDSDQKQGLFASHPEMTERLKELDAAVAKDKSGASAALDARYKSNIKFQLVPIVALTVDPNNPAATAQPETKAEAKAEPKKEEKKGNPLSGFLKGGNAGSNESKQSASVTGSAASRGVDRERAAKGGPYKQKVPVAVTDGDIATFIAEGKLKS